MKLRYELLSDEQQVNYPVDYKNCFNARGLYHSMQFVLRLRPDLHKLLESTQNGIHDSSKYDSDTIQAFSTYLHETIHWWQHIGSTSGFLLSLSYPAQCHINSPLLKEYIQHTGLKKPIIKYNEKYAKDFHPTDKEFLAINPILNNFHDIEFFKSLLIQPKSANSVVNDDLFESVGHSFHITYSSFVSLLSSIVDREVKFMPKGYVWDEKFKNLTDKKIKNHCYGESAYICPIGLIDLFEGQARFSQMQYLYFSSNKELTWSDFEKLGMLKGVYYSAFEAFLTLTDSEKPLSVGSPLIALYLLILDLSINPAEGFPFDIKNYEEFINSTHPGIRFMNLCSVIKNKHPEFKEAIINFSSSEYYLISTTLSGSIESPSTLDICNKVCNWLENEESIIELMKEEQNFDFKPENQPIRLLFSQFIKYQKSKKNNPAFFCWPGAFCAGNKATEESLRLFLEHQALFSDKADGDIYPRDFPDKEPTNVQKTFDTFYTWVATYDLCRQWIVSEGEFDYDYFWLSSKHSIKDMERWARHHFKLAYGIDPIEFEIID